MAKPAKRKCPACGKWFKTARANAILCPEDEAKERQKRAASVVARSEAAAPAAFATAPPHPSAAPAAKAEETRADGRGRAGTRAPRVDGSLSPWETVGVRRRSDDRAQASTLTPTVSQGEREPARREPRERAQRPREPRPPAPPFEPTPEQVAAIETRYQEIGQPEAKGTQQQIARELGVPQRAVGKVIYALRERQRMPTPEQVAAIEARYRELAQPEFDGIRHQIAHELGVPLRAVREAVKALREREGTASWWEARRPLEVPPDQLEAIREKYLPTLPLPPIGIHRQIAEELELPALLVYDAITRIRDEMELPPFNERPDAPPLKYPVRERVPAAAAAAAAAPAPGTDTKTEAP